MTTAKLRKTAAGVVENRVGMVHFRVNTWQNGSYGRFSHLRFLLSAAPRARLCRRCRPMARRGVPRGRGRLCSAPAIEGPAGRLVFVAICAARHRRRGPRRKWLAHRRLRQAAVWHCKTGRIAWRNRPFGAAAGHVWQRHSAQVAARKGSCKCFSQPTPHCPDPGAAWGRVRTICLPACILMV